MKMIKIRSGDLVLKYMIGNVRVQKVANIVANSLLIEIIDIG